MANKEIKYNAEARAALEAGVAAVLQFFVSHLFS